MKETELSKAIRDALTALGIWNLRIQAGMIQVGKRWIGLSEAGTPDVCLPSYDGKGNSAWLEIKTATGKVSDVQKAWHARAVKENVRVAVVRTVKEAIDTVTAWKKETA